MTADLEPRLRAWLASQAPTEVPSALADRVARDPGRSDPHRSAGCVPL